MGVKLRSGWQAPAALIGVALLVALALGIAGIVYAHQVHAGWGPQTVNGVTLRGDIYQNHYAPNASYWANTYSWASTWIYRIGVRSKGYESCDYSAGQLDWDTGWQYGYNTTVKNNTGQGGYGLYCVYQQLIESYGYHSFYDPARSINRSGSSRVFDVLK